MPGSMIRSPRHHGLLLAALSASMFSLNTVCARLAFARGANAAAANAARCSFAVLVFALYCALTRERSKLSPRQRLTALGLAVPFVLSSFGYLGALQYIPASTAVLVAYTYPILVGLFSRFTEGERFGPARVAALLLAFAGVAMALDVQTGALPDWRGVALAFLGAIGLSVLVTGSGRLLRGAEAGAVNLHLSLGAAAIFLALLLVLHPTLPQDGLGWLGFAGVLVTYPAGQLSLLAAVERAGPVRAAVVMNLEPLITIGLAVMLAGEALSLVQLGGAALVVTAVFLMRR